MGALRRVLKAVERGLDGPPLPPAHDWPSEQAWALVVSSETNPGHSGVRDGTGQPSMLDDLFTKARGVPYRFDLEVHRPDRPPYPAVRQMRIPSKVEGTLFLSSHAIPAGVEVPLLVKGGGDDEFELDWDGYLAVPLQADRAYYLRTQTGYVHSRLDRRT